MKGRANIALSISPAHRAALAPPCPDTEAAPPHAPLAQMAAHEVAWQALSATTAGGLGSTWEWCWCWCHAYLDERTLRTLVTPARGDLGAVMPMVVEDLGGGPVGLRLGRLAASDSVLDHCAPPVAPACAREALAQTLRVLFDDERCDAVVLGPLPEYHPLVAAAREPALQVTPLATLRRHVCGDVFTQITLAATFDDYLNGLDKDERKAYRRRLARFAEVEGGDVTIITDPQELAAEFPLFVDLHARQWRSVGKLGHFGDWPGALGFHTQLLKQFGRRGRAWLVRVSAGGQPVAYQYVLCSAAQARAFLLARDVDARWKPYGLGTLAFFAAVQRAIEEGKQVMDVGRGHYEYKLRHGAAEVPLHTLLWVRNAWASRVRARVLRGVSMALHKMYYRLWFARLAPRLRVPRKPLWKSWIRTRL